MTVQLDSSALAATPSFEITDPEQISGYMSNTFRPNKSIVRRKISGVDFRHNSLKLGDTTINVVRYGIEARVDAPPAQDVFLAMFTLAGSARVDQGDNLFTTRPGTFCVLNPSRHLKVDLSRDFEQLTVRICGDAVRQSFLQLASSDLKQPLEFMPTAHPLDGRAASFGRLIKTICDDMSRQTSGFSHPSVSRHLEQAIVNLLLTQFPHNYSSLLEREGNTAPAPYFVRRAEEYMREHLEQPLCLHELASASGTSVRTLQSAFRKYRNTTPTTYLREKRLEAVRKALLNARDKGESVTEVAVAHGFTHLSKFAQYYRARFGESPSQTLKY